MRSSCPRIPLLFAPVCKTAVWGGGAIAARYARRGLPPQCGESWELSAIPGSVTHVESGPCAGAGLDALAAEFGADFTGARAPDPQRFPLLLKIIDARRGLSVQVHPGDGSPPGAGAPKAECWVVLDAAPGAALYAGVAPGVARESFAAALAAGDPSHLLDKYPARPGEILYLPGGTIHSIGAGCLLFEVQQASTVTWRLFDWNRTGLDGKPRPLHIAEAMAAADFSPVRRAPFPAAEGLETPHFAVKRFTLSARREFASDGSFQAFFAESGGVAVRSGGASAELPPGRTILVPACAGSAELEPLGPSASIIRATL